MEFQFKLGVNKFQKLHYQQQLIIKERGRPMPDLNIEVSGKSRGKTYTRKFNKDMYLRNQWICGCSEKNAFFCFPCALFGADKEEKLWRETGVRDLVHLSEKIKKHENTQTHMNNEMRFALFGKLNIQAQLDSAYWINIQKHNEEVTKNRYVLSKIIDCIKFCGAFELALRGHDESETSDNPGIFRGLVNFSAELDKTLSEHLTNATIFKGTSKTIQNDILDCMLEVYAEEILNEINEAPFLAVIADETTDVSMKFQMVIVFRYVKNGAPVERFWTFLLPEKHDAETLANTILNVLDPILKNNKNKLIAQSYDGAAVMSGIHGGVQTIIKRKYETAHFVHCYAHQLNLIMSRACSINSQVRVFFGDLHDIPGFFSHSPQRIAVLNQIVGKNIPRSIPTRWNFNIRTVNVVYEYRDFIIECMEQLEEESNAITSKEARGLRRILEDQNFTFWLTVFHYIMPHVDVLYNNLQKKNMDPTEAQKAIHVFEQSINNVRNKIDPIIHQASNLNAAPSVQKRKRPNNSQQDHRIACLEVCDVIINNAKERFAYTNHLVAATLLSSEHFEKYNNKFPENELDLTCTAYNFFDKNRLRTELSVLYSNIECRTLKGAVPLLKFIISNNLEDTLTETKKLIQILVTTPMTTAEAERSFSTLKRIKTFLRNSMREDRLTALSTLSIEKKFIASIPNFNDKVIEKFATKKDRRINFQFRKMQ